MDARVEPGHDDSNQHHRALAMYRHQSTTAATEPAWPDRLFEVLKQADIRQVGYVPDAGHARLIDRCKADAAIRDVVLTTEEEGVALAAGAWLGGERAALLMQSSGVGNCINMLSLMRTCRFPLVMIVTMRGEWEEFNPWQVPMGSIVEPVLRLCEAEIYRVENPTDVAPAAARAFEQAFGDDRIVAILLSQQLIGRKLWIK
jgi:sulfopyruvate decarboxylase alpha subunit